MDISELPFFCGILLILVALFTGFFAVSRRAKRLSNPWMRLSVQLGATVGAALSVILLALLLLVNYSLTARGPVAYSPDGKHVAVVTWAIGPLAVNDDIATVKVRPRYSPFSEKVFSGPGYSNDSNDLQVRWIDNNHLLVRYDEWFGYNYRKACAPRAFGIEVICERR